MGARSHPSGLQCVLSARVLGVPAQDRQIWRASRRQAKWLQGGEVCHGKCRPIPPVGPASWLEARFRLHRLSLLPGMTSEAPLLTLPAPRHSCREQGPAPSALPAAPPLPLPLASAASISRARLQARAPAPPPATPPAPSPAEPHPLALPSSGTPDAPAPGAASLFSESSSQGSHPCPFPPCSPSLLTS